jgi:hypothetical protein
MDEVRRRITELNALQVQHAFWWFVCCDCGRLCLQDDGQHADPYLATSKWGYERPFCAACHLWCDTCEEPYCREMACQHDECSGQACECDKCRAGGEPRQWYVPGYADADEASEGEGQTGWWVTTAPLDCLRVENCDVSLYMTKEQCEKYYKLTRWFGATK